ncbi:MAG: rhodanese-like domain-containing protein [Pseudomonadales bacterium]|nr:rhodanese-like domain-containing protein [Pseudomonadales bacterium]
MTTLDRISANEFSNLLNDTDAAKSDAEQNIKVIDVRTPAEIASERLPHSIYLPLQSLTPTAIRDCISKNGIAEQDTIYLLCGSGMRAEKARQIMAESTSQQLVVIEGGISALKLLPITITKQSGGVISLERQVRIAAGSLVLVGILLATISPTFLLLSAFVGAGLVFAGVTDNCGMALLLTKMPWNHVNAETN